MFAGRVVELGDVDAVGFSVASDARPRALTENGEAGSDPLAQYHLPVGAPGLLLIPAAAALLRGGPGAVDAQLDTC